MKTQSKGVKGYKQIHLKRFPKAISHNLKLLALSRDQNLYELHSEIINDYVSSDEVPLTDLKKSDVSSYNVFVEQEAIKRVEELSTRMHVTESEIYFSALVTFAYKHNLTQEL